MNNEQDNKNSMKDIPGQISKNLLKNNPLTIKIKLVLFAIGIFFLLFLLIISVIYSLFKPIIDVMLKDDSEIVEELNDEEKKFRDKVNNVYDWAFEKYGVQINKPLLVSTVLYGGDFSQIYNSDEIDTDLNENSEEVDNSAESEYDETEKYSVSTSELKKLAKMMISKEKPYVLDDGADEEKRKESRYYNHLKDTYVPSEYSDYIDEENRKADIENIIEDIYDLASMYSYYFEEKEEAGICGPSGTCTYTLNGTSISNIKVRLMKCSDEGTGSQIEGEELVDFEKYVLGVVYAEVGAESNPETQKSQAIAARSYALTRPAGMGNTAGISLKEEDGQWILSIRNCTEDQVYCDPDKGCYAAGNDTGNTVHSGSNGTKQYKGPLPSDASIRSAVAETNGKVALNSKNEIAYTPFLSSDQKMWAAEAAQGKTYTEIILKHYNSHRQSDVTTISESNCSTSSSSCATTTVTGPFTNWKQSDPAWGSIKIGTGTIKQIGCAATSVAIQIARSGLPTNVENFNPGTFVEAYKKAGGFSGDLIIWNKTEAIAPGFYMASDNSNLCGLGQAGIAAELKRAMDEGCYPVLCVRGCGCGGSMHWVAVESINGNQIMINDPAGNFTEAWSKYGSKIGRYICYKKR